MSLLGLLEQTARSQAASATEMYFLTVFKSESGRKILFYSSPSFLVVDGNAGILGLKKASHRGSRPDSAETNLTCIHEDADLIPGLAQ